MNQDPPRNVPNRDLLKVANLDSEYQEAVKKNDSVTMDQILADDFALITGTGKVFTKTNLLDEAKSGKYQYEHQEDSERTVRLWSDTAVVPAKPWAKGTEEGKPFEYKLWFSDTYVRKKDGSILLARHRLVCKMHHRSSRPT